MLSAYRLALLLLVFNLVLPNLVCAKVAVVKVSGVVVLGINDGTGDGDPLYEFVSDVGDGADDDELRWFKLLPETTAWGGCEVDVDTAEG